MSLTVHVLHTLVVLFPIGVSLRVSVAVWTSHGLCVMQRDLPLFAHSFDTETDYRPLYLSFSRAPESACGGRRVVCARGTAIVMRSV
jgi:hypothetical protein